MSRRGEPSPEDLAEPVANQLPSAAEAARRLGLATIGVLLEAKRRARIDRVIPCVDRLVRELRFFVSPALRRRLAELATE